MAFGQYVDTRYQLDKADVILALDGDFLSSGYPGFLFMRGSLLSRRNPDLKEKMSRFYSMQSTPTNTSGKADNRCRCGLRKWSRSRSLSRPESVLGGGSSRSGCAEKVYRQRGQGPAGASWRSR